MIVAEFRVGDAAVRVDHHLLVERCTKRLRHAALDLAAALHGIGDDAGVRRLNAPEDLELTRALVHRDAKAVDVEADRARRAAGIAAGGERLPALAREFRQFR